MYPKGDNAVRATEFLHEYNKELVKNGEHEVRVIFLSRKYPALFKVVKYVLGFIPQLRDKVVSYRTDTHMQKDEIYFQGDIKVAEMMLKKYIPHGEFPRFEIKRVKKLICRYLKSEEFSPDVVLLDFLSPCALIGSMFPNSKVFVIPHYTDLSYIKKNSQYITQANNAVAVLFRSPMQQRLFEQTGLKPKAVFHMLSGVPQRSIDDSAMKTRVVKFMTACRLIKSKNVMMVLRALMKCKQQNWEYTIAGNGEMYDELKQFIIRNGIEDKCQLVGWKNKDEVAELMLTNHCFVMPSEGETFGMVYVEAMSKGCIPVGARGEGIDGVIIDGYNGYLVDSHDETELTARLDELMAMDKLSVSNLSKNGIETAKQLTTENLTQSLVEFITESCTKVCSEKVYI